MEEMYKLLSIFKEKTDENPKHVFDLFELVEETGYSQHALEHILRHWNNKGYIKNIFFNDTVFYKFTLTKKAREDLL